MESLTERDDLIRRSDAIQAFDKLLKSPYGSNKDPFGRGIRDALKLARDMMKNNVPKSLSIPAVDAVEVVRCQTCKNWTPINNEESYGWCSLDCESTRKSMHFCGYGKRREE